MAHWLPPKDLAGMPGMRQIAHRVREHLMQLGVPSRPRQGRGGGLEFDADSSLMPAATLRHLATGRVLDAPDHEPAKAVALPAGMELAPAPRQAPTYVPGEAERAVADARLALLHRLFDLAPGLGTIKACDTLALTLSSGQADDTLREMASTANGKRGAQISQRTLMRWASDHRAGGWAALLPKARTESPQDRLIADDVAQVLALYMSTSGQFRNLTDAAKEVTARLDRVPTDWHSLYGRARRALPLIDKTALIKSRHTGSQRVAKLPFIRRGTDHLAPNDVWVVDGHSFKAKVRHPIHGSPFAPEVTVVLDWATRKAVGWSVSLSENTIAVGDALRHAVTTHGLPAIVYSDNGSGETGKLIDCPITGLMARMGAEHHTGRPGNPQARGVIERSWQSHMLKAASTLPTYQGKTADAGVLRKVSAALAKEQRALARAQRTGEVVRLSDKCAPWAAFIDLIDSTLRQYNETHEHRSLPKQGQYHMTPSQAWTALFQPGLHVTMAPEEARLLFMPMVTRVAKRGEVRFDNNVYSSADLMQVDEQTVRVQFDLHDASYVLVFSAAGEFVCRAGFQANTREAFAVSVVERAQRGRTRRAIERREKQIDLALRELSPQLQASAPGQMVSPLSQMRSPLELVERVAPDTGPNAAQEPTLASQRPAFFASGAERYEWLMRHPDQWQGSDTGWMDSYTASADYDDLADYFEAQGIASPKKSKAQWSRASNH